MLGITNLLNPLKFGIANSGFPTSVVVIFFKLARRRSRPENWATWWRDVLNCLNGIYPVVIVQSTSVVAQNVYIKFQANNPDSFFGPTHGHLPVLSVSRVLAGHGRSVACRWTRRALNLFSGMCVRGLESTRLRGLWEVEEVGGVSYGATITKSFDDCASAIVCHVSVENSCSWLFWTHREVLSLFCSDVEKWHKELKFFQCFVALSQWQARSHCIRLEGKKKCGS